MKPHGLTCFPSIFKVRIILTQMGDGSLGVTSVRRSPQTRAMAATALALVESYIDGTY